MITRKNLYKLFDRENRKVLKEYLNGKIPAKQYGIRITSGTSGGAPLVRITRYYKRVPPRFKGMCKPVVLVGSQSNQLTNLLFFIQREDTFENATILFLEYKDLNVYLPGLLRDFNADNFLGLPSFLCRALAFINSKKILSRIKRTVFTGELYTNEISRILKEKLPLSEVSNQYACAEIGGIGNRCLYQPINFYHLTSKNIKIDLININDEGIGELVVSKQVSRSLKVNDYLIGDSARFINTTCPCGKTKTFEIIGRSGYDYIKLIGTQLHRAEFERIASKLELYIKDFRVIVTMKKVNGCLMGSILLRVLPKKLLLQEANPEDLIKSEFEKQLFVTANQTLGEVIKKGIILPLRVELVNTSFPVKNKEVKLQFIHEQ